MLPYCKLHDQSTEGEQVGRATARQKSAGWVILSDLLCCVGAWFFTGWLIGVLEAVPGFMSQALWRLGPSRIDPLIVHGVAIVGMLLALGWRGHYRMRLPFFLEARQLAHAVCATVLMEAVFYYSTQFEFSRPWLFSGWAMTFVAVLVGRVLVKKALLRSGVWDIPTLVVGDPSLTPAVCGVLRQEPQLGYAVTSTVDLSSSADDARGEARDWSHRVIERYIKDRAQHIILAMPQSTTGAWQGMLRTLNIYQIPYAVMPQMKELSVLELDVIPFYRNDVVLLAPRHRLADPVAAITKRAFDLTFSLATLAVIAPFMAILSVLIRADGGPVVFSHRRVGRDGKEFHCYKFRTMVPDAQQVLANVLETNPAMAEEWASTQKLKDDPRVTPIGKLLRKYSLDELPQLFNVVFGDMSLVGPRPVTRSELREHYGENAHYYHATRPGITGVWQVSGRSDTSYTQRVSFDGWYVRNWSLWHDLAILFQTVPTLLFQKGAY